MKNDIAQLIGAVAREVDSREVDGKPARVIIATRVYDANVDDVWDALTSAERIPRWFLPIEGDLRVGGRYQIKGNASGTITQCEPPQRLALTWEYGGGISWVSVQLAEAEGGGTRLELEHVAHVEDGLWDQFGPGAVGVGWDLAIMGLGKHLEGGAGVDPEQAAAWGGSEEGKAFMRASSEDWRQASIAAGTDEAAATAAAARTTAFYTGESAPATES
ncbi:MULTISPECIES: SRPBCC family protein [Rhodomicrobium]|uniref:SRPBCC family protein n=1 Tax=Rhodomicrobium TaxID=1068 RepID=UPI000B4AE396|nr:MULTISPECIES: SRPBCC family protein [Rhodomicrobium]